LQLKQQKEQLQLADKEKMKKTIDSLNNKISDWEILLKK
jgi:hypothetical protein